MPLSTVVSYNDPDMVYSSVNHHYNQKVNIAGN
jgi:hypothetical protein